MTDGVRRLSHEEAEMLISARMDEYLDRADSRALLVHLQTCESCRAFAVQSEVLGRELAALPVLPASAVVDRQVRESIRKGRSRWSLSSMAPSTGGSGGMRLATTALAMLALVSVFLLVRMAGDQNGEGGSIDAPSGGVAQQIEQTPASETAMLGESAAPTETPRLVITHTPAVGATNTSETIPSATESTDAAVAAAGVTESAQVESTATLDSSFVYSIDKTKTPESAYPPSVAPTETSTANATEASDDVSVAMAASESGSAVAETATQASPQESSTIATPAEGGSGQPAEPSDTPGVETNQEATTAAEIPSEGLDSETQTATPTEPTVTPTAIAIEVDATEAPSATTESATVAIGVGTPAISGATEATSAPESATDGQNPTATSPATTSTPNAPLDQPTIAPISDQTGGQQSTGAAIDTQSGNSPQIVPSGAEHDEGEKGGESHDASTNIQVAKTEEPGATAEGDATGNSPQIVPSDGTTVPEGVGGDNGQANQNGNAMSPTAIPTADSSVAPFGLDLSDTITTLPAGTSSTAGRLEFSPGMNLYVVVAPDGQLAVADLDGELVVTFGESELPVWSGSGLMFSTAGDAGTKVGVWDSETGNLSYIEQSADKASDDLPIGGDGTTFYYLRSYPDTGIAELRSATIDGSDNGVLWTSDEITLAAPRPLYSAEGVYLPTKDEWLFVDWDGNQSSLGANSHGFIGVPVLSPGEGLMAYSAGDQVIVAWTTEPDASVATAPFYPSGGFAFATTGEEIVVSDGSSLHVFSYLGEDLGTLGGTQPIGGVFWLSDTIYYLQIGKDAALKSTSLGAIQAG